MCRVRTASNGINHLFRIAVIGSDNHRAALLLQLAIDPAQLRIHSLDGSDRRLEFARVTHHIGIREVHDDQVECGVVDCL